MKTTFALFLLLNGITFTELSGATYYLDSNTGDDSRNGKTADTAWRSLELANRKTFQPGDHILLRAGSKWEGVAFEPQGSGSERRPIVVDQYGDGPKPAEVV